MGEKVWDAVIVGAGPAGLMAGITCARGKLRTLVLDGKEKIGAKLLISGGGRCNVTCLKATEQDFQSGEPRTVRNILRAFPPERTLAFFKELGVEMVLEEGTKYFPEDQSARSILAALLLAAHNSGVVIAKSQKVEKISKESDRFRISGEKFDHLSKTLLICTGGLSYPGTGSDGSGYALAKSLGHSIVPTQPALTPLLTNDPDWKRLSGITLPVALAMIVDDKRIARSEGALLFTHLGFSGPAVLDMSGPWLRCDAKQKKIVVSFLPGYAEAELSAEFANMATEHPDRSWKRFLAKYFPEHLVEVLLQKSQINAASRFDQTSKKDREIFIRKLFAFPILVTGFQGYEKAEVTSGGVDIREVDSKTLESRLCPGLFFAGEILDVDGRIGGFNFQWAWASGAVAGQTILRQLCGS